MLKGVVIAAMALAQQGAPPAAAPPAAGTAAVIEPAAPADTVESLQTDLDLAGRMTVPVYIDGKGPFPFTIDTGADHSVVSDSLARVLALPPGKSAMLHDITGAQRVETAIVGQLRVGTRDLRNISAPILVRANLGAVGMLGIDSLSDQRIVMDFKANRLSVHPSPRRIEADEPGTIVVRGRRRFGQLVLVDSHFRGSKVYVIVDTGAETSIGNFALRRLVTRKLALNSIDIVSVTGHTAVGDVVVLPEMQLSDITLRDVPVAFADLHTFTVFGVEKQPAMLLGMDVLRAFDRVSVDFTQKEARFRVKAGG